jgi:hypothetical protein
MRKVLPFNSGPNSSTAVATTFSLAGAVAQISSLDITHAITSNPFKAAASRKIWTKSLETTKEYVINAGAPVFCPPATSRAFLL